MFPNSSKKPVWICFMFPAEQRSKEEAPFLHPGQKWDLTARSPQRSKTCFDPGGNCGTHHRTMAGRRTSGNDKADICMIGRANLCEPEFCNKAQAGHEEDIRPCIGCLRCLNGIMFGKRVACTVNPSLEPENEDTITPAKETKNILVIGGGPAGMEAAYVAAKRGHHVVLADRQDSLGGTVRIAAVPIAKQDLTQLIKYQAHKLEQAGVKVLLNTEVTLETIQKDYPDYEVILCAGATPVVPQFMTQFKDWMTADDVLYGRKFPGRKIVVIGGGSVGCETADYLAPVLNDRFPRNREITLIEMAHEIMEAESGPGRSLLVQRMMEKESRFSAMQKWKKSIIP